MQIDAVNVTVDNELVTDFSIMGMFMQADTVVKAVMIILVLASIWSWAVMIEKSMFFGKVKRQSSKFENAFWSGKPLDELFSKIKGKDDSPMSRIFAAGMTEWDQTKTTTRSDAFVIGAKDRIDKRMNVTVARELEKAESGMSVLATIGSAATFIGLFGTVWGIMNSFQAIAATKDTNLAVVAPGIAEALFATGLGLIAAIPAVIGYNRYSAALNSYGVRLYGFADEFSAILSRQLDERGK